MWISNFTSFMLMILFSCSIILSMLFFLVSRAYCLKKMIDNLIVGLWVIPSNIFFDDDTLIGIEPRIFHDLP